jgi:hypothetical protein
LPQVEHGDQDAAGVGQQRPAVVGLGLAAGTAALAVFALFGLGGLQRCQPAGQRAEFAGGHPGQPGAGEHRQGL